MQTGKEAHKSVDHRERVEIASIHGLFAMSIMRCHGHCITG